MREKLSLLITGNGSVLVGWFYKENKVLLRTDIFIVQFNQSRFILYYILL